jgi:hypothetical protein
MPSVPHGSGLLSHNNGGSPIAAVKGTLMWTFDSLSHGFWHDQNNQREYLKWLKMKLGFKSKQDFVKVTRSNFHQNHGKECFVSITTQSNISQNKQLSAILG